MRKKTKNGIAISSLLAVVWLVVGFAPPAHAQYTDPGSTALLVQIIAGMIFGAIFYFGVFRNWLANKLNRNKDSAGATGTKSE
jgi:hypothetical protein